MNIGNFERTDLFDGLKTKNGKISWKELRSYGLNWFVKSKDWHYCCFAANGIGTWEKTFVLRSLDCKQWEDTEFPYMNEECQNAPTLSVDKSGNVHLAFQDYMKGKVGYSTFDGECWNKVERLPALPDGTGPDEVTMVVDNSGNPIVIQCEHSKSNIFTTTKTGDNWQKYDELKITKSAMLTGTAIDKDNSVHVLLNNFQSGKYNYYVKKQGTPWNGCEDLPVEHIINAELSINKDGCPCFTIITNEVIYLLIKGDGWIKQEICKLKLRSGDYTSTATSFDENGNVHIAWKQNLFPVYRNKQIMYVSSAAGNNANPINLTQDDSLGAEWGYPCISAGDSELKLIIPNQKIQKLYFFQKDLKNRQDPCIKIWNDRIAASDKSSLFLQLFNAVNLSASTHALMTKLVNKANEFTIENGCLKIMFGGYNLFIAPPAWIKPDETVPASCASLISATNRMVLITPDSNFIVLSGIDTNGELEITERLKQDKKFCGALKKAGIKQDIVRTAFMGKNGVMIFNPLVRTKSGEPALCFLNYETNIVEAPISADLNFADIFFSLLAQEILHEDILKPAGSVPETDKPAYQTEWESIVSAKSIQKALADHFSFLSSSHQILDQLMEKAESATIIEDKLHILFHKNYELTCYPPIEVEIKEQVPDNCRLILDHHSKIELKCKSNPIIFFYGLDDYGDLYKGKLKESTDKFSTEGEAPLIMKHKKNYIVFHDKLKTNSGEPILCSVKNKTWECLGYYNMEINEVLLRLVATEILGKKFPITKRAKPEISIAGDRISLYQYSLDLSNKMLTSLPSEIGQLENLEDLDLSENQLKTLPAEIGNIDALEDLNLSKNQIELLPEEFGKLSNLKELDLSDNLLTSLPSSFGQLENLEVLNILKNPIKEFPQNADNLKNLLQVYADNIPVGISNLKNLEELHTHLLSPEIGQISSLKKLSISFNNELNFPENIGELKNLIELWISDSSILELPPDVFKLKSIQKLTIVSCKQILSISADIEQLKNLKKLCLNGCTVLKHIPEEISMLEELTTIQATHTALSEESMENLCNLKKLEILNLTNVQLNKIPENIGKLKNLKAINLQNSNIPLPYDEIERRIKDVLPDCRVIL